MSDKIILLLAANPKGAGSLRLQEEEREIKERLRLSGYGKVPIYSAGAVRPRDIQQAMLDFNPQIVHFSGHGQGEEGLVFENDAGQEKLVNEEALADLFALFSDQVECVVLNACYSKVQAVAIAQKVDYVIGMSKAIGDKAAIEFSVGFYSALGANRPYEFAYNLGRNAILLENLPEHLTPVFIERERETLQPIKGDANINLLIEDSKSTSSFTASEVDSLHLQKEKLCAHQDPLNKTDALSIESNISSQIPDLNPSQEIPLDQQWGRNKDDFLFKVFDFLFGEK